MKNDDYWKGLFDDLLWLLVRTYGAIAIGILVIGIILKIFGYL